MGQVQSDTNLVYEAGSMVIFTWFLLVVVPALGPDGRIYRRVLMHKRLRLPPESGNSVPPPTPVIPSHHHAEPHDISALGQALEGDNSVPPPTPAIPSHHHAESHDISSLGQALESLHVNWKGFERNCVSVTIAKILRFKDVDELWESTYGQYSPQPGTVPQHMLLDARGLVASEIQDLIRRTTCAGSWKELKANKYRSMSQLLQENRPQPFGDLGWGAAYIREGDEEGHCVVMDPSTLRFTCYQHNPQGLDLTDKVVSADRVTLFSLRKVRSFQEDEFLKLYPFMQYKHLEYFIGDVRHVM